MSPPNELADQTTISSQNVDLLLGDNSGLLLRTHGRQIGTAGNVTLQRHGELQFDHQVDQVVVSFDPVRVERYYRNGRVGNRPGLHSRFELRESLVRVE